MQAKNNNNENIVNLVEKSIFEYFNQEYNLSEQAVSISFKRIPELNHLLKNQQLKLNNPKGKYVPGYQTIWLYVYENHIFKKKFPVLLF